MSHCCNPLRQESAASAAAWSSDFPARRAISGSIQGWKSCGASAREVQQEVGQVPFGIDDDGRDALQRRFFEQGNAQTGFPGAGHPGDHRVGGQVGGIVGKGFLDRLFSGGIVIAAKIQFGFRHPGISCIK